MPNRVVAIVGMAGAGKSEVARSFEKAGYKRIRFGDITDAEIRKRGLELNEQNERRIREQLRRELGMAAYAKLNLPAIDEALKQGNVVADGLYSWEEYLLLKEKYGDAFVVVAVWAPPATRYARLARRRERPLSPEQAAERDRAELEKVRKGAPIAMADYTLVNQSSMDHLRRATRRLIEELDGLDGPS